MPNYTDRLKILNHRLLSRQRTESLIKLAQGGDLDALTALVCANQRMIFSVALKYSRRTRMLDIHDLMQEGSIALTRSIKGFNPRRGVKFSTYAFRWIKGGMMRAVLDQDSLIRRPQDMASHIRI